MLFLPEICISERPNQRVNGSLDLMFMGMWDVELLDKI